MKVNENADDRRVSTPDRSERISHYDHDHQQSGEVGDAERDEIAKS